MRYRGFLLQPTYRIESGIPIVVLTGRLEDGRGFRIRDRRQRPHFFVRTTDAGRVAEHGGAPPRSTPLHTMAGEPVARVEVPRPADAPPLRDRLLAAGVPTFEADVRFAMRYLIDRGIRGALAIDGEPGSGDGGELVFEDPETGPADWTPSLSVLSLDIETDPSARRLLSIALHGRGASEVLLLTPPGAAAPAGSIPLPGEAEVLAAFVRRVRELDPDVITGWNVIDFDLAVLDRMAARLGVPLRLGRGPEPLRLQLGGSPRAPSRATVAGRAVLDGIALLRGSFIRMEEYSLDFVAREVLGEGKLMSGADRAGEILRAFREDRRRFVDYNLADARLALGIVERLRLVDLAVARSRLTGMPLDRVAASIASFDFLYLSELRRRGMVAPTVARGDEPGAATAGGHVLEPEPGLHRNVLVFDFRSLYPSIIRTFQIDPAGHLPHPAAEDDPIVAPGGAAFRRAPGILPGILDDLFPLREQAKAAGDRAASQAIKILMNSFYGVLGTPACRFYNPDLANAITSFGREILLWSRAQLRRRGRRVLYGDTDSLFVLSGNPDVAAARQDGEDLVRELNRLLADHVRKTWRVESRLELEFEKLYLRLMLPPVRHGTAGARKRYAGLVDEGDSPRVVFTGMEVVRRDWTPLARKVQAELYRRLFADEPVEDYLRRTVERLRAGAMDSLLVYRKALRKDLRAYTSTTPPHVAAARKRGARGGRLVSYVMTVAGPEPAEQVRSPLDREHYVQKQVRPVSEPVLATLGLDFDRVVGDDTQGSLF